MEILKNEDFVLTICLAESYKIKECV